MDAVRDFIAIDFETATVNREPCQLGIVVVKNEYIVQKMEYLIRPKNNEFDYFCLNVHGINMEATKNAPEFKEIWEKVSPYFNKSVVVAHNASFDKDVLFKALNNNNLHIPDIEFICTYQLSGLNLEDACLKYGVALPKHHNALCDAEAAANIYLKIETKGVDYTSVVKPHVTCIDKDQTEYTSLSELNIIDNDSFIGKDS